MANPAQQIRFVDVHPLVVRVTHWLNTVAMVVMIGSGWQIYNASPLFPFKFPQAVTIGHWLGGAIAWHLAGMWLLVGNGLVYFAYGIVGRHFLRSFVPLTPALFWRDLKEALTFRLRHRLGAYNAVQRAAYLVVLVLGVVAMWSGLALWKPVQLQVLAAALGGYEIARRVHFFAMSGIVAFIVLHLVLVALVPRTLIAMITGRARVAASHAEVEP